VRHELERRRVRRKAEDALIERVLLAADGAS
jgi:hypothetical protein